VRALLTARKLLQTKNHDVEMSLRGVLRGFGLKVGPTTPRSFAGRIRELVAGHATLSTAAEALLAARGTLFEQWQKLEKKRLRSLAREDDRVRRLMTAPGVGTIVALTYASAIDDPARFRSSKSVGAHFTMSTTVQNWRGVTRWPAYRHCCSSAKARWLRGASGNSASTIWRIGSRVCWEGTDLLREEKIDALL